MTILTFPTLSGLSFPVKKTPMFQTISHRSVSGVSTSQSPQAFAIYAYELPFEFLRSDNVNLELQTLMSFFQACRGRGSPFHFNDPDDNAVAGQGLGIGDGVTTDLALVRTMGTVVDPIQDAIAADMTVYVDGVSVPFTALTTAQYGTIYGVSLAAPPSVGQIVSADFNYNFLCWFDGDAQDFSKFMNKIWEATSVKFSSKLQ
jgi:uncharacterized protein (TIGR02217 family)